MYLDKTICLTLVATERPQRSPNEAGLSARPLIPSSYGIAAAALAWVRVIFVEPAADAAKAGEQR